jgi:hypothetical protein
MVADKRAWTTLAWLGALIALCDGLNRVGFIKWFTDGIASHMKGFSPMLAMVILLLVFFVAHYLFASVDAYTTALLPVILLTGISIPGIPVKEFALLLCMELGIMGSLRPSRMQQAQSMPIVATCRLGTIGGSVRFSERSSLSCSSPSTCLGRPCCGGSECRSVVNRPDPSVSYQLSNTVLRGLNSPCLNLAVVDRSGLFTRLSHFKIVC